MQDQAGEIAFALKSLELGGENIGCLRYPVFGARPVARGATRG